MKGDFHTLIIEGVTNRVFLIEEGDTHDKRVFLLCSGRVVMQFMVVRVLEMRKRIRVFSNSWKLRYSNRRQNTIRRPFYS